MIWQRSYWVGCYILGTVLTQDGRERYQIYFYPVRNDNSISNVKRWESKIFFQTHVRSLPCLVTESVIQSITNAFAEGITWISQSCLIYLSMLSNVFIALWQLTFIVLVVEFYFSFRVMIDVFFMRQNTPPRRQEIFRQRTLNFHKLHSKQYEKSLFRNTKTQSKKYEKFCPSNHTIWLVMKISR